ncbi:MAG: hypothetical protein WAM60_03900 [Candidatus Promineifilaceae bacterium]
MSETTNTSSKSKKTLVQVFTLGGILGIVAGLIHLTSGLRSEFTNIIVGDMAINMLFGLLSFLAAWLLKRGNKAVFIVVIAEIIAGVGFAFAVGRGLNFVILIAGAYFLWQLYGLWKQGELAGSG